jgi:hypothetical protein
VILITNPRPVCFSHHGYFSCRHELHSSSVLNRSYVGMPPLFEVPAVCFKYMTLRELIIMAIVCYYTDIFSITFRRFRNPRERLLKSVCLSVLSHETTLEQVHRF